MLGFIAAVLLSYPTPSPLVGLTLDGLRKIPGLTSFTRVAHSFQALEYSFLMTGTVFLGDLSIWEVQ